MDPFDDSEEQWETYIESFEHYGLADEIRDVETVLVLLSVMSPKTYGFMGSLMGPAKPGDIDCKHIVDELQQAHFALKSMLIAERLTKVNQAQWEREKEASTSGERQVIMKGMKHILTQIMN